MKRVVIYQAPFAQTAMGFDASAEYRAVWGEDYDDKVSLEKIWKEFQRIDDNNMPPDGYEGRSLSIGDVVAIGDYEFFTPKDVGWRKLTNGERAAVIHAALGDLTERNIPGVRPKITRWAENEGIV